MTTLEGKEMDMSDLTIEQVKALLDAYDAAGEARAAAPRLPDPEYLIADAARNQAWLEIDKLSPLALARLAVALAGRLAVAEAALGWYADPVNWERKQGVWDMASGPLPRVVGQESDIELDRGRTARAALAATGSE